MIFTVFPADFSDAPQDFHDDRLYSEAHEK